MVAESAIGEIYFQRNEPQRAIEYFRRCLVLAGACAGLWCRRDVLAQVIRCTEDLGRGEAARRLRTRLDRIDREILAQLWGEPEGHDRGLVVSR
jgi:hypothetical protein